MAGFAALCLAPSCGKKQPTPQTPVTAAEPMSDSDDEADMAVMSEIGGLNESKVSYAFKQSLRGLTKCIEAGAARNEYLSGEVTFFVLIDRTGSLAHAHAESSTLGDRATEKCMLEVLAEQQWPKPVGGEKGEARKSFTFEIRGDVRPPIDWDPGELDETIAKLSRELETCKGGNGGTFATTLYVDASGRPLAAGIAPPNEAGEQSVDCLVEVLMAAKYPSPGSWPAKVTLSL